MAIISTIVDGQQFAACSSKLQTAKPTKMGNHYITSIQDEQKIATKNTSIAIRYMI
jgi:hypothetical protein